MANNLEIQRIKDQKEIIRNISMLSQNEVYNYLNQIKGDISSDFFNKLKNIYLIQKPYNALAVEVSLKYYNAARLTSKMNNEIPFFASKDKLTYTSLDSLSPKVFDFNINRFRLGTTKTYTQFEKNILHSCQQSVTSLANLTIDNLVKIDAGAVTSQPIVRSGGCPYCLLASIFATNSVKLHPYCRCASAPRFRDDFEDKYSEPHILRFKADLRYVNSYLREREIGINPDIQVKYLRKFFSYN